MKVQKIKCFTVLLVESAMIVALITFCVVWPRWSAAMRHAFCLAILPFAVGVGVLFSAFALRYFPYYHRLPSIDSHFRISNSIAIGACIVGLLLVLSALIIFKVSNVI